jgi:hypothetical protein
MRLPFLQQNLMESGSKVQNGEPRSTIQLIDDRYQVLGLEGEGSEVSVIHAKAPCVIFLFD